MASGRFLDDRDIAYSIQDAESIYKINHLRAKDLEDHSYKLIKSLKGLENG